MKSASTAMKSTSAVMNRRAPRSVIFCVALLCAQEAQALASGEGEGGSSRFDAWKVAVVDPRPVAVSGKGTDLDLLERSIEYSAAIRRQLRDEGAGIQVVDDAAVRKRLGPHYRVRMFECESDVRCLVDQGRRLLPKTATHVLVGSFSLEKKSRGEERLSFSLLLVDLRQERAIGLAQSSIPAAPALFPQAVGSMIREAFGLFSRVRIAVSEPPDRLWIDGVEVEFERGPIIEVGKLTPGTRRIRAERAGYADQAIAVSVAAGESRDVYFGWVPVNAGELESAAEIQLQSDVGGHTSSVASENLSFLTGFDRKFYITSPDKQYRLNLGMRVREQFSVLEQKTEGPLTQQRLRLAQIALTGSFLKRFGFTAIFGFEYEKFRLDRFFGDVSLLPWLTLRAGLLRVIYGRETNDIEGGTAAIEKSTGAESLAPAGDVGAALLGQVGDGAFSYGLSVINGSGPGIFSAKEGVDVALRLLATPLKSTKGALAGLSLGGSAQLGKQPFDAEGVSTVFVNRSARDVLLKTASAGLRQRYGADIGYDLGPLTLQSEFFYERQSRARVLDAEGKVVEKASEGMLDGSPTFRYGGYAEVAVFVFGDASLGLELFGKGERYIAETRDGPGAVPTLRLSMYTTGVTLYLHSTVRLKVNGVLVDLDRSGASPPSGSRISDGRSWLILTEFALWFL